MWRCGTVGVVRVCQCGVVYRVEWGYWNIQYVCNVIEYLKYSICMQYDRICNMCWRWLCTLGFRIPGCATPPILLWVSPENDNDGDDCTVHDDDGVNDMMLMGEGGGHMLLVQFPVHNGNHLTLQLINSLTVLYCTIFIKNSHALDMQKSLKRFEI